MLVVFVAILVCGVGFLWLSAKVRAFFVTSKKTSAVDKGSASCDESGRVRSTRGMKRTYRHHLYPGCPPKRIQNRTGQVVEVEVGNYRVWEVPSGEVMTVNVPVKCIEFRVEGRVIDRFDYGCLPDVPGTWIICPPVVGSNEASKYSVTYLEGERGEAFDFLCPVQPKRPVYVEPHPPVRLPPRLPPAPPPAPMRVTPPLPPIVDCPYRPHPLPPPPPPTPGLRNFIVHIAYDNSDCTPEVKQKSVKVWYSTDGSNGIQELADLRHGQFYEAELPLGQEIELIFDEHGDRPGEELSRQRFPLPAECPDRNINIIFGCVPDSEGWQVKSFETS